MENKPKHSVFQFVKYIVNESSITIGEGSVSSAMQLSFNLDVKSEEEQPLSELSITLDLNDAAKVLSIKVRITGYFKSDCDKEQKDSLLCNNAPAILFPYIRAYISCMTAQSGISPVIIPTLNLQRAGAELLTQLRTAK